MNCPTCKDTRLVLSERQGIEIDYCPECRGVWLDRGELDKILERAQQDFAPAGGRGPARPETDRDRDHDSHHSHRGHRKKNIWMELFD